MIGQIREAIQDSGKTLVELSESTHVSPSQLSRFLRGERDLTLTSAARVCEVLGLRLVGVKPVARPAKTVKPTPTTQPPPSSSPGRPAEAAKPPAPRKGKPRKAK
jgi:transcriptional regulator with XRE-family HTH domain